MSARQRSNSDRRPPCASNATCAPLIGESVALFLDRARAARPGWEPDGELEAVERICRLLDDLPLGIELAAARVSMLSPKSR